MPGFTLIEIRIISTRSSGDTCLPAGRERQIVLSVYLIEAIKKLAPVAQGIERQIADL